VIDFSDIFEPDELWAWMDDMRLEGNRASRWLKGVFESFRFNIFEDIFDLSTELVPIMYVWFDLIAGCSLDEYQKVWRPKEVIW